MNKLYLLTLLVLLAQTVRIHAQRITLTVSDVSLDTVFARIQEQSPYRFVYTSEELSGTRRVSFSVQKAPIETVLNLSFKGQPVDYSMEDPYIYVRKKEENKKTPNPPNQIPEIRGKISNEQGDALEGATIQIDQLTVRTLTNARGEFILKNIATGSYELVITFIGYERYTTTVKVGLNDAQILVTMKRSINNLDETVIKGYYKTTKRFNTGDVSMVTGEDIQKQPVSDPVLALEGRVPGLFIRQTSGVPGADNTGSGNIYLRGRNSIANGTNPLFIVDGVPMTSTTLTSQFIGGGAASLSVFNTIDPTDIENIEILKDADATAIYGSRGANGVVLITTKRGKAGKTKVSINVYSGDGKVDRKIHLLNTQQYLEMRHEAFQNDGRTPSATDYDINGSWDTTRYTDWQKVLIGGTAHFTKGETSISGGNATTQFIMGGSYSKQTTVFPGSFYDQVGAAHLSVTHASTDGKFHAVATVSYSSDNNIIPTSDLTSQITLSPDAPPTYVNGQLNWQENSSGVYTFTNPLAVLQRTAKAATDNLVGNAVLSYEFISGLVLSSSLGYNKIEMNQTMLTPLSSYTPAAAGITALRSNVGATNTLKTWIAEPQLDYKRRFANGDLDVLVGSTIQQNSQNNYSLYATDFPSDQLINDVAAAATVFFGNANYTEYKYNGLYGRIGLTWVEKYLLNVTARRDGSSRFGPGYQFGNFGAVGAGWIFSKEKFFQNALPVFNFGKLRLSYGTTGNDQIQDYQYLSSYSIYDYPYQGVIGLYPTGLANPTYRWEVVRKMEMGLDLGFIKNRILINGAYYLNRTGNQLVGYSLPSITGFTTITANLPAKIQNSGLEIVVSTINIIGKKLSWSSSANISFPMNKLLSYPNLAASSYANVYTIGQSLFSSKGYHFTGVNPTTGVYQFEDINKDGVISSPQDFIPLKPITQKYYGGLTNTLKYKGFILDLLIQFVDQTANDYARYFARAGTMVNQPIYVLARWQKAGDVTTVQKFSQNNAAVNGAYYSSLQSDYAISNASFVRLKNLALSYDVPLDRKRGSFVTIYVQGQNLVTITKFKGLDPESGGGFTLPPLRMIVGGVRLNL